MLKGPRETKQSNISLSLSRALSRARSMEQNRSGAPPAWCMDTRQVCVMYACMRDVRMYALSEPKTCKHAGRREGTTRHIGTHTQREHVHLACVLLHVYTQPSDKHTRRARERDRVSCHGVRTCGRACRLLREREREIHTETHRDRQRERYLFCCGGGGHQITSAFMQQAL